MERAHVCTADASASSSGPWCGLSGETQGLAPNSETLRSAFTIEEVKREKAPARHLDSAEGGPQSLFSEGFLVLHLGFQAEKLKPRDIVTCFHCVTPCDDA